MKSLLSILIVFLVSYSAKADLKKYISQYLKNSNELKSNMVPLEYQRLLLELETDKRPLTLSANFERANSTLLTSALVSEVKEQKYNTNTISLGKEFIWGGTFSVSGIWYNYEKESASTEYKSYTQAFSYSQDISKNFFGRNTFLNESIKEDEVGFQEKVFSSVKSKSLIDFIAKYIEIKKEKTILSLQKDAQERAQKRFNLIGKQVKDGLKEKVDFYSSKSGLIAQKELLEQKRLSLLTAKANFEKKLEASINLDDIESYEIKETKSEAFPQGNILENLDAQALNLKLDYLKKQYEVADNSVLPKVLLGIEYNSNQFGDKDSSPFSEGTFGSENREKVISLQVIVPLGFNIEKNARKQANLEKLKTEYDFKTLEVKNQSDLAQIKVRIRSVEKNLKNVLERYELAKLTVTEFNKLYNRGRANLDQVLRAEEELIQTEQYFVQYTAQKELELYGLYEIYGQLFKKVGIE